MAVGNNTRALNSEELEFLNDRYSFELIDEYIVTKVKGYDRKVLHDIDKSFVLNTPIRKITITEEAIKYWIHHFRKMGRTLLDVQNAINSLIVTYQDVSKNEVENALNNKIDEIKKI